MNKNSVRKSPPDTQKAIHSDKEHSYFEDRRKADRRQEDCEYGYYAARCRYASEADDYAHEMFWHGRPNKR